MQIRNLEKGEEIRRNQTLQKQKSNRSLNRSYLAQLHKRRTVEYTEQQREYHSPLQVQFLSSLCSLPFCSVTSLVCLPPCVSRLREATERHASTTHWVIWSLQHRPQTARGRRTSQHRKIPQARRETTGQAARWWPIKHSCCNRQNPADYTLFKPRSKAYTVNDSLSNKKCKWSFGGTPFSFACHVTKDSDSAPLSTPAVKGLLISLVGWMIAAKNRTEPWKFLADCEHSIHRKANPH